MKCGCGAQYETVHEEHGYIIRCTKWKDHNKRPKMYELKDL